MILRCQTVPVAILVLLGAMGSAARADGPKKVLKPGDPVLSIPLDDIGFEMPQPRLLLGGATMYSLNFIDNTHLLVTFNSHGLIPRDRDMTPQDEDRLVTGLVVELPAGKVLAKTTWHTRDREQYLWPLSHGMFLLRLKNKLTVLDPLGNLASGDAFRQESFLDVPRRVGYVSVSPGGDLLVLETLAPAKRDSNELAIAQATGQATGGGLMLDTLSEPVTEVLFFRLIFTQTAGRPTHLLAQSAGRVTARSLIRVPATSEGFLDMLKESAHTWLFDFQSHEGKRIELSPFDTTCVPSPYFISRSEFVAFGCAGGGGQTPFSEFNLRGEEPWVQMMSGAPVTPMIVSAPDAGRFALSRMAVDSSFYDLQNLSPDEVAGQDIAVYQNHDGRTLLKLRVLPVQRAGQNFDLSPDGLSFVVIRNGNVEIYQLPALSPKDLDQVKLAAKDIPQKTEARVRLTPERPGDATAKNLPAATAVVAEPIATQVAAPVPQPSVVPAGSGGLDLGGVTDGKAAIPQPAPVDPPRTAPSLYGPDYPKPKKPEQ